jgi:hypothetical protein
MESGVRTLTATDLSSTTTSKQESYAAVGVTSDGRRYRYGAAGGAVTAGNLVIAPSLVANHQNITVQTAAAAGATTVYVTLGATAATADQYAEGQLVVGVDNSGVPVTRKVKGNTSGNSGTVIQVFLDQKEPLLNALTTSNVVSLSPNLFNGVVASATAGLPVGVAVTSVPSGSFGWFQVFGPVGVVNDAAGALSALGKIKQSATVAGAVVASTVATDIQVGYVVQAAAASKAGLAFVTLD